ncbi:hypothetical protein G3O06_05250 [Burkholderia sp. Ac-20345]|uniref:hypothetical protein n=1 Tax=Burkholderia sp. Ac-20345 TaxID=2703891 RepID=UPI00197BD996|nr:hypothetical protein [Burkholderia sp. Ac-20345]MBN3776975.1 hypothetical protein [Burkholderia sp. Ac-20345]
MKQILVALLIGTAATAFAQDQMRDAWAKQQPTEPNGSVDLRKWPGWLDAFVRRTSSSDKASPNEVRKS